MSFGMSEKKSADDDEKNAEEEHPDSRTVKRSDAKNGARYDEKKADDEDNYAEDESQDGSDERFRSSDVALPVVHVHTLSGSGSDIIAWLLQRLWLWLCLRARLDVRMNVGWGRRHDTG